MRLHALVNDNIVTAVTPLEESGIIEKAQSNQMVLDIHDQSPTPAVGWLLAGNALVPPTPLVPPTIGDIVKAKITAFQKAAPELLTDLYVSNTLAGISTNQSIDLFNDYGDVLRCIREGAWPTAYALLSAKAPSGFVTQAHIDSWKTLIMTRMMSV